MRNFLVKFIMSTKAVFIVIEDRSRAFVVGVSVLEGNGDHLAHCAQSQAGSSSSHTTTTTSRDSQLTSRRGCF